MARLIEELAVLLPLPPVAVLYGLRVWAVYHLRQGVFDAA